MKRSAILLLAFLAVCSCGVFRQTVVTDEAASDDDMVNVGYSRIHKDNMTTSVSKVKINSNDVASYSDIYDYLRGRVPGVYVGPSSMGSAPRVIIRGIGSVNSSTDPLYLVDGVEVTDISFLNPHDVSSVEVLKDGSASIYGVRGANGVILITTKNK